jgi:cell division protein FtsI/penicillin-binding protein 2
MKPHLVESIINADGTARYRHQPEVLGRPIKPETARTMREMMLGVAANGGTARRAAIRGYSIAGKTGTAQKSAGRRGYLPGLYRATFCGIVPSGVVKRHPEDEAPVPPRIVVLVTLDFDTKEKFHQGGNSAGPVFKRITTAALRYLAVEPDKPEDVPDGLDDEFDKIMDSRGD